MQTPDNRPTLALFTSGRLLFGIGIVALGVQHFVYGRLALGLPPLPDWMPFSHALAYLMGAVLIAAGACIVAEFRLRTTSLALGILLFVSSCLHLSHLHGVLFDGNARTGMFEPLSLAAVALVLSRSSESQSGGQPVVWRPWPGFGRALFAFTMVVFGWQHFLYLRFLVSLVPAWIPFHYFWIVFTGVVFIAAGISIFTGVAERLMAFLLGLMFFGWVLVLHGPRIAAHIHNRDEWSSGFIALALAGGSFLVAATAQRRSDADALPD